LLADALVVAAAIAIASKAVAQKILPRKEYPKRTRRTSPTMFTTRTKKNPRTP
jgi:hypothetical protein